MKKSRYFKSIILCIALISMLTIGVFAWIYGDITPGVKGEFKVGSDAGLIIDLNSGTTNTLYNVSQNTLTIALSNGISLNESSSVDGETIFKRKYDVFYTVDDGTNTFEQMTFATATANQVTGTVDYIDAEFNLTLNCSTTDDYYIYFLNGALNGTIYCTGFNDGTGLTDDSLKVMRAALKITGLPDASWYGTDFSSTAYTILANHSQETDNAVDSDATNNPKAIQNVTSTLVDADTQTYADTIYDASGNLYSNALADVALKPFSDYCLGNGTDAVNLYGSTLPTYSTYGFTDTSAVKYICKLNGTNNKVSIKLRIWLEGQSSYCTNSVIETDDIENLGLYFVAYRLDGSGNN